MAGKNCADIVFCIDVSGSMDPCLKGVCQHVGKLLDGLVSNGQMNWDVRFDFLTFSDGCPYGEDQIYMGAHFYHSVHLNAVEIIHDLYHSGDRQRFFTRDVREFTQALGQVETFALQQHQLALDIAADFPWRPSDSCHRVVVLLSDDWPDTRHDDLLSQERLDALVNKIQRKRIKLFMVAPENEFYGTLASIDRSEYDSCERGNLTPGAIDFGELLGNIGKSVSSSQYVNNGIAQPEPVYGQQNWPLKPFVGFSDGSGICILEHEGLEASGKCRKIWD